MGPCACNVAIRTGPLSIYAVTVCFGSDVMCTQRMYVLYSTYSYVCVQIHVQFHAMNAIAYFCKGLLKYNMNESLAIYNAPYSYDFANTTYSTNHEHIYTYEITDILEQ